MSKSLYIIQDAIGTVGTQLASSQARAVALFAASHADASSDLTAYAMNGTDGSDRHPEDTWVAAGDSLGAIVRRDLAKSAS